MALAFSRNRRALRADLPFTEGRRGWRAALSSERSGQGCARSLGRAPCGCRRAPRPGSPRPSMLGWPTGQKPAGEGLSADGVQGRGACDLVWEHVLLSVPLQTGRLPPGRGSRPAHGVLCEDRPCSRWGGGGAGGSVRSRCSWHCGGWAPRWRWAWPAGWEGRPWGRVGSRLG